MLPTVKLKDHDLTRLVIGGNPFSGNSHVDGELDREMTDYFSMERIKQTLFDCEKHGINAMQVRGDRFFFRLINEYRLDGGRMQWIAQTASEFKSFEGNAGQIMQMKPAGVYLHGTLTDALFKQGEIDQILWRLQVLRKTGVPIGIGTHMPEVIERAEQEGWDVDYYMACVFNLSKIERESSAVTGIANEDEPFDDEDPPLMYKTVRGVSKPCHVFKILGASRRCKTPQMVRDCFIEAYANIKPIDLVVVGMFPKYGDQVAQNVAYAKEGMSLAKR